MLTVNVMVDGERIHRVVGRESEGTTRTQAEEFIQKVRRDARDGRLSLPEGREVALGFSEAADKYLDRLEGSDGRDVKMKRARLKNHLKTFFGLLKNWSLMSVAAFLAPSGGQGKSKSFARTAKDYTGFTQTREYRAELNQLTC